jgi:hypothetical protein
MKGWIIVLLLLIPQLDHFWHCWDFRKKYFYILCDVTVLWYLLIQIKYKIWKESWKKWFYFLTDPWKAKFYRWEFFLLYWNIHFVLYFVALHKNIEDYLRLSIWLIFNKPTTFTCSALIDRQIIISPNFVGDLFFYIL